LIPPPDENDVVIRQRDGNPSVVFRLGTPSTPDQFTLRTRNEALSKALTHAIRQHVRAWFAKGDDDFVLLGTFREPQAQPARSC
jgi:hypothetical protein